MKKILLIAATFIVTSTLVAQKQNKQIEINPFIRLDNYPKFSYHYYGRASTDFLKMKGTSYGIVITYKYSFKNNLFIKTGLGYFKYSFDKLDNTNSLFGNSKARPIDFVSPLFIQYSTDKYHYNNILIRTGIGKEVALNEGIKIITCFDLNAYYNFLQYYHLTFAPYNSNLNFSKRRKMLLGFSNAISSSITKQFNQIQIGPSIILPIFDSWKKDLVFQEEGYNGGKNKWLNGIGVGVICNISLHKKIKS
ncbi:MAG: hypothetical protein EPO57_01185 [Chitinophagaceae bacterium]|nr:MAG: hypothetical protein EPO57_01185 [Chitinophagaceae bacterium]